MPRAKVTIHVDQPIGVISPNLHGHFIEHLGPCIDGGIWVGPDSPIPNTAGFRNDVLTALRQLEIPVLRWPGGCYADDYHWENGVGPRKDRPRTVNLWWGQNVETNGFGTHEFISLCRYLGAEPYFGGNVGSGTVRELRDWVEYCNYPGDSTLARRRAANGSPAPFGVRFWGVGNEAWGCGGNMGPEDYAALYRQYSTYLRDLGEGPNRTNLFLIACGPDGNRPGWTRRFLQKLLVGEKFSTHSHTRLHGLAAHYYCAAAGTATEFTQDQWYELLEYATRMEPVIVEQRAVMDEFDPGRKVGLLIDEWGTWHPPTPGRNPLHLWQQNTLRDALAAAITLDTFHRHADKVVMANLAQLANVLQCMVMTDGPAMCLTPTYYVFDLYKPHKGATAVRTDLDAKPIAFIADGQKRQLACLSGSASLNGRALTLTVVNAHATLPVALDIDLGGVTAHSWSQTSLCDADLAAHNLPETPLTLRPVVQRNVVRNSVDLSPASVNRFDAVLG